MLTRNPKIVGFVSPNHASGYERDLLKRVVAAAPNDMASFGLDAASVARAEVLGSGANGTAFLLPDRRVVLKVTADEAEAALAERLAARPPTRGLPVVHYVAKTSLSDTYWLRKKKKLYVIVMEFAQPFRDTLVKKMLRGEIDVDEENEFVRDLTSAVRFITKNQQIDPSTALQVAYDDLDVHVDNLGVVKRGGRQMLVVVDLGQLDDPESLARVGLAKNSAALSNAKRAFNECFDKAERMFPDLGTIELHEDEAAGADNGSGSERQFGYCAAGDPIVIAFAPKVESLPMKNIRGLMAHEFGHAIDFRYGKDLNRMLGIRLPAGVERRADAIAKAVFGKTIEYDERLIQCVDCDGTSPRPRKLGP